MARVMTAGRVAIGMDETGTETGTGDAVPILFLHGVGSDKSVWAPQLAHFGAKRRAVALDYPGYGESDPVSAGTTRDDFAGAMWASLDGLGIGKTHICGLSLGGVIAIAMHHAAAERCASLIIADSFAVHPNGQAIYDRSVEGSENMAALAESRMPGLVGQDTPAGVLEELIATMSRVDPAAFRIGVEAVWLADQRDRLGEIYVPTLVIVGDRDPVTPPALSQELVSLIAGAQLQSIAGAGHLTNIEMPERFNAIVETFINGVEAVA